MTFVKTFDELMEQFASNLGLEENKFNQVFDKLNLVRKVPNSWALVPMRSNEEVLGIIS